MAVWNQIEQEKEGDADHQPLQLPGKPDMAFVFDPPQRQQTDRDQAENGQ
jgi:hypothetical protein